jgi:hypothetical protein
MKKLGLVIGVTVAIVAVAVAWYFLRKKNQTVEPLMGNVMAPAPEHELRLNNFNLPTESVEMAILSHARWVNANNPSWASSVRTGKGFTTQQQACIYIGITEGKTLHKDVPSSYAGTTDEAIVKWIKKYVQ